jgi:hypothetical protein
MVGFARKVNVKAPGANEARMITWTAVFSLPGMDDAPQDVKAASNALVGARLNRALCAALNASGWSFADAHPEDHGWHAEAAVVDAGKSIVAHLVTCPEIDGGHRHGSRHVGRDQDAAHRPVAALGAGRSGRV